MVVGSQRKRALAVVDSGSSRCPPGKALASCEGPKRRFGFALRAYRERLPRRRSLPAAPLFGFGSGLARLGSYLSRGASPHPAALSVNSPVEKTNPSVEATFSMEHSLRD